jgi:hypothetical protein
VQRPGDGPAGVAAHRHQAAGGDVAEQLCDALVVVVEAGVFVRQDAGGDERPAEPGDGLLAAGSGEEVQRFVGDLGFGEQGKQDAGRGGVAEPPDAALGIIPEPVVEKVGEGIGDSAGHPGGKFCGDLAAGAPSAPQRPGELAAGRALVVEPQVRALRAAGRCSRRGDIGAAGAAARARSRPGKGLIDAVGAHRPGQVAQGREGAGSAARARQAARFPACRAHPRPGLVPGLVPPGCAAGPARLLGAAPPSA